MLKLHRLAGKAIALEVELSKAYENLSTTETEFSLMQFDMHLFRMKSEDIFGFGLDLSSAK